MDRIDINYTWLKRILPVFLVTVFTVLLYLVLTYLHPQSNEWLNDGSFSWYNFYQFLLFDQIAIEFITFLIISFLIRVYAQIFNFNWLNLSIKGWFQYQFRFLPLFFLTFFFFNPITQTLRFLYHTYPHFGRADYFENYFYSFNLYLTYLPLALLGGYTLLNLNLFIQYRKKQLINQSPIPSIQKIEVIDPEGKRMINLDQVICIERKDRKYFVSTAEGSLRISATLYELEALLDASHFHRINRSTIINLQYLKNYSFWENDKYIIRLTNGSEFVASRKRVKSLRDQNILDS